MANLADLFVKLVADTKEFKEPLERSAAQLESFATGSLEIGAKATEALTFTGAAAAILALGTAAFEAAEKFEEGDRLIARSTGATGAALDELSESFKKVYAGTAQSSEVVSRALSTLAVRTGETGKALEELTAANLTFAKVTRSDVNTSVLATQRAFGEWGVATDKQVDALNSLYFITTKTGVTAEALAGQLQSGGAAFKAFGFSITEAAALLGQLEKSGLGAEATIMALTRVMAKWAKDGIEDPKAKLVELIARMKDAATAADAVGIAVEAGFVKGAAVKIADAARSGAFAFEELATKAGLATTAMGDANAAVGNWKAEWTKLWHEIEIVLDKLGAPLLHAVANATKAIADFINVNRNLDELYARMENRNTESGFAALNEELRKGQLAGKSFHDIISEIPKSMKIGAEAALDFGIKVTILKDHAKDTGGALDVLGDKTRKLTQDEIIQAAASDRLRATNVKAISTIVDFINAGTIWGKQLAYVSTAVDDTDLRLKLFNDEMDRLTVLELQIASVDPFKAIKGSILETSAIMRSIGLQSTVDLRVEANRLGDAYLRVVELNRENKATTLDVTAAYEKWSDAERKTAGISVAVTGQQKKALQEVSTIINDMSRSIAQSIIHWKGFGDAVKGTLQSIGEAILRNIIQKLLESSHLIDIVVKGISVVLSKIPGLGSVFGGATSAAGGAASAAGGVAGSAGAAAGGAANAGGSVASAASSSLSSWIGAISGAVTAVSSIVGNFQSMAMNKSLDLIEKSTRYSEIHLFHILEQQLIWLPNLNHLVDIWGAVMDVGNKIGGAKGGNVFYISVSTSGDAREQAQAIIRELKAASPAFAT